VQGLDTDPTGTLSNDELSTLRGTLSNDELNTLRQQTSTYTAACEDSWAERRYDESDRQMQSVREGRSGAPYRLISSGGPNLSETEKARMEVEVWNTVMRQNRLLPGTERHMGAQVSANDQGYETPSPPSKFSKK
jgi:hypothetical protein